MKKILSSIITAASVVAACSSQADDIEIFVGENLASSNTNAQVLIIFDNSGSMGWSSIDVAQAYNPENNYLTNNASREAIYWTRGAIGPEDLPDPTDNSEVRRFFKENNACSSSEFALFGKDSNGNDTIEVSEGEGGWGYYTDFIREYKKQAGRGTWSEIPSNNGLNPNALVDCWQDIINEIVLNPGEDNHGSAYADGYPVNGKGTSSTPIPHQTGDDALSEAKTGIEFNSGEPVTLYTGNYLAWANGIDQSSDSGSVELESQTRMQIAQTAITDLISTTNNVDWGLMTFNPYRAFNDLWDSPGSSVVQGLRQRNATEIAQLIQSVDDLVANESTPLCESVYEAYLYLAGKEPKFGDVNKLAATEEDSSVWASSNLYKSPLTDCNNEVHIILMTDGAPQRDYEADTDIAGLPASQTGDEYKIGPQYMAEHYGDGNQLNYLPSLAKWMHNNKISDSVVANVHTIGFGDFETASAAVEGGVLNPSQYLYKTATEAGGEYYPAENAVQLQQALTSIVLGAIENSSSFSSPSIAVNTADPTRTLDNLYFAMFEPSIKPGWIGNLKKLTINGVQVEGQGSGSALDGKGNIESNTTTLWSEANSEDGNNVAEGGVAEMLTKMTSARTLYTNNNTSLTTLNKSNLSSIAGGDAKLITAMDTTSDNLDYYINWLMGKDVDGTVSDNRSDIFGDPLHSKPAVINYGKNDIRIVVGTNAGFLHMFKDNDGAAAKTDDTVTESWAFMPYSFLSKVTTLKDNAEGSSKIYGMDGSPTIYMDDGGDGKIDDGDKVWLFVGMRRGGSKYFAFDITNPDSPSLMWIKDNSSEGYGQMGQTWSKPSVIYHPINKDESGNAKPTLIFGAGYDENKDINDKGDNIGLGVYMVDAATGNIVWKMTDEGTTNLTFPGTHSVPSDVAAFDGDFDGYVDRLYVSDTGGNVWRADIPGTAKSSWTVYKFAELGVDESDADVRENRKFYAEPAVARSFFDVTTIDEETSTVQKSRQPYDAIVIGSGNRASPLESNVQNTLFVLRDHRTLSEPITEAIPPIKIADLLENNASATQLALELDDDEEFTTKLAELSALKGWYYDLSAREKSLSPSIVLGGIAYFTSYTPSEVQVANTCVYNANGKLYAFDLNFGIRLFKGHSIDMGNTIPDSPPIVVPECDGTDCEKGTIYFTTPVDKNPFSDDAKVDGTGCESDNCDLLAVPNMKVTTHRTYIYTEEKKGNN